MIKYSSRAKYGLLITDFEKQRKMEKGQHGSHPITMNEAKKYLSEHRWDEGWEKAKSPTKNPTKSLRNETNDNSGRNVHMKRQVDESIEVPTLSINQMEGKCYCCGQPGHVADNCRLRETMPKEHWAIRKSGTMMYEKLQNAAARRQPPAQVHTQSQVDSSIAPSGAASSADNASRGNDDDDLVSWMATQIEAEDERGTTFSQAHGYLKMYILLDN